MSQFHLDQYERNRDQGLDYLKAGQAAQARYHLLTAAKYLLQAATRSEASLRAIRHENALRLRDLAFGIKLPPQATAPGTPAEKGRTDTQDAENLTPESKWMISEKPNVRFDQIAGLADVKDAINLRVIYPARHPEVAGRFHKKAGGGLLLYGPPGTGKTLIAKAIATELDAQFLNVKSSNVMSQWVGVAERNLAKLFEVARRYPVAVVFLDECEALVGRRGSQSTVMNRVIPEFLSQVDGINPKDGCILLLGATNRPWDMDEAALRTGRFGEKFYVGLPDQAAREQILHLNLDGIPMEEGVDFVALAAKLDGYSGADIAGVCTKATDYPFHRQIRTGAETVVTKDDLERAAREVTRSVSPAMLAKYQQFSRS